MEIILTNSKLLFINICNMKAYESGHKENASTRLKTNELGVQDINSCITEFNCDPFDPVNDQIRTLHSGQYASKDLEEDLLSAANDSKKKVIEFFKEPIFSREKDLGINNSNRKTFLTPANNDKDLAKNCKTTSMENYGMSNIVSKVCGVNITLLDILQYRVTTECLSTFNTNGTMIKTQKSKLLQSLTFKWLDGSQTHSYAVMVNMGFMWRMCFPSPED